MEKRSCQGVPVRCQASGIDMSRCSCPQAKFSASMLHRSSVCPQLTTKGKDICTSRIASPCSKSTGWVRRGPASGDSSGPTPSAASADCHSRIDTKICALLLKPEHIVRQRSGCLLWGNLRSVTDDRQQSRDYFCKTRTLPLLNQTACMY
jgi:hypothetical protein